MLQERIKRLSEPRIITRAEEWWPTLGHHAMIIYIVSRHGLKMVHYLPLKMLYQSKHQLLSTGGIFLTFKIFRIQEQHPLRKFVN